MNNEVTKELLKNIDNDRESLNIILENDRIYNPLKLDDLIRLIYINKDSFLPFNGHTLLTEGDIEAIIKIIISLTRQEGNYILFINHSNIGTITYLIKAINKIYERLGINVFIEIDYSRNYNFYMNDHVTLIGSKDFVNTSKHDFIDAELIYTE